MTPGRAAALALLLPLLPLAGAGGAVRAEEPRAQLEQRLKLVARLFSDPASTQRIHASGQPQAVHHLDEARVHHALADAALRAGEWAAARREIDEALRHIGQARRMAPDTAAQQTAARQRHLVKLAALEKLLDAWSAQLTPEQALDGDLQAALGLMETARWFAGEGRHIEGLHTVDAAERHALDAMKRWMQGREVDYTQRAGNSAEAFEIELRQHASLADLLPLALAELRPRDEAAQRATREGEASRGLRAQALLKAREGDVAAARGLLLQAQQAAQRALEAAGLSLPAPSGSPP